MVSVLGVAGVVLIVAAHTAIAAVLTRVFRVRLKTRWGAAVFALLIIPVVLTLTTLLLSGVLGIGGDLGSRGTAVFVAIFVPLALGILIDYVWMPAPEEVELPATTE
ncbi:MAG: hypothetical protein ABEH66_05065 [Halobacteriales archaeon]